MTGFEDDLKKFRIKTMEKYVTVKRQSAMDLFSSIVLDTPVDKGTLRNNWFAAIGSGSNETTEATDKVGSGTITRIDTVLAQTDIERDTFLTNNLPYAFRIEYDGWSWRAPEGMVRINTIRWDKIVENNARKVLND